MPVSDSADEKAWRVAKRKFLTRTPSRLVNPIQFFRDVEDVKRLALSGDPHGTIIE